MAWCWHPRSARSSPDPRHSPGAVCRYDDAVSDRPDEAPSAGRLLPTTLVGSCPQPAWLIDRDRLAGVFPPRVRMRDLWRVADPWLTEAQDDAVRLAVRAQEEAGLDIVSDGEMRRESYSNQFATALDGIDLDRPGTATNRSGRPIPVPRIVGPIRRRRRVFDRDLAFLRSVARRPVKITVPGPFTMLQQAQDDHYGDEERAVMDYAAAVNEEVRELVAGGAAVVQIDEPWMQARPDRARRYGVAALNRALEGVTGVTCVHVCFGYAAMVQARPSGYSFLPELAACVCTQVSVETAQSGLDCRVLGNLPEHQIMLGVIDLSDPAVESPDVVAGRIRRALPHVSARRLVVSTDCGMKYLDPDLAYAKLRAMVAGADIVRREIETA